MAPKFFETMGTLIGAATGTPFGVLMARFNNSYTASKGEMDPAHELLALLEANFITHFHRNNEFEYQGSLFQPVGGMDMLAKALHAKVKESVRFGCEAKEIRKTPAGARLFATELYAFLYGPGSRQRRFDDWLEALADLPQRGSPVLTWPVPLNWAALSSRKPLVR